MPRDMPRKSLEILRLLLTTLAAALLLTTGLAAEESGDEPEFHVLRAPLKLICADGEDCHQKLFGGGYLGVGLTPLTSELRAHFGVPDDAGIMVSRVSDESPAAEAGLQVGDIITAVDGETVSSTSSLGKHIQRKEEGEVADIDYYRSGELYTASAHIRQRKAVAFEMSDLTKHLEGLGDHLPGFSHEAIQQALQSAHKALQGQDWQQHVQRLQTLDLDGYGDRMEELQERLEQLEKRLQTLDTDADK